MAGTSGPNPSPRPFRIDVPESTLTRIRTKLADTRWPTVPPLPAVHEPWGYGADPRYLRELVDHWLTAYDWRAAERRMNRHPQFIARIDGVDIHYVHVRGSGERSLPLILTHGWPGSFHEFDRLIEPLCFPERNGGDARDSFDLVIPSLPGFGFSSKPTGMIGLRRVAVLWHRLMTDVLGYTRYGAHGGDMGSAVTTWLALNASEQVAGIHLNLCLMAAADVAAPQGSAEEAWARQLQSVMQRDSAYQMLHNTRPLTVGLALADNPLGTAAWIVEKLHDWSDVGGNIEYRYSKDQLITAVMIYLVTETIDTSIWMYRGSVDENVQIPAGRRVTVPTACAAFPKEFLPWPPRSRIRRTFDLQRYTEMPAGGHFPAMEEPLALAEDIRSFFSALR
jgi:pimeloyl-ACP methyl ester carboxylesterase